MLATKIQIPPQPARVVHRAHLIESLESGIPHVKLGLVGAPAGYGKTTLLGQWAEASQYATAWLTISEQDNDLERFLRYLLASWEAAQPGVMESELGLLLGSPSPDSKAVLSAFINVATDLPDHMVFVLDDYHLIEAQAIHEALTFLLDHLPPRLHFVLAGRGQPLLRLARYRARQELLELRDEDLQFLPKEAADFFNSTMALDLTDDAVARLQAASEGWVVGLQLAALGLQRGRERPDKLTISGRQRFIADYLREDVLAPLPDDWQQFLLQTSILEGLCGSLCDATTGRQDSQMMLEQLEHEKLFLVPLDDRREWYRYHHLFGDFLREALIRQRPDEVPNLHRRAARWYLDHDLPDQAFQHALASDDIDLVSQILERYIFVKLLGGEIKVVQRWLESIPAAWHTDYPMISFARAGALLVTGQFDACADRLDETEQLVRAKGADVGFHPAWVTAMRCSIACFQNDLPAAETLADRALDELPEGDLDIRAGVYGSLGDTYRRNGYWQKAQEAYLKMLDYTQTTIRFMTAHVFGALADLALRQGRLQDADGYWRKALIVIRERENWGRVPLPVSGWVYIRRGELQYEWNKLPDAWDHLSRGLERAELGGDARALIAGYLIAGRVKLTQGDIEAAEAYLERARPHAESARFPHWGSRFERFQLEVWLAQDRLRAVVDWLDGALQMAAAEGPPGSEIVRLAAARALIVRGDTSSSERALALLEDLLQLAEAEGRMGVAIEALALRALAHWRRGERPEALTALERALRLAEPEGYLRLFADLGLSMARLLQEAQARDVLPEYVARLLAAFGAGVAAAATAEATLPEPLTEREQEILELVAAGLTNREIAEQLVISPQTVKKHTSSIYGKLGVGNRTEATAKARELDLLN